MKLSKFSIGMGDRFEEEIDGQLDVVEKSFEVGMNIFPVWNKSFREHTLIGSSPKQFREKIDKKIKNIGWRYPYFIDADHITMENVDYFLDSHNYFTMDVSNYLNNSCKKFTLDNDIEFIKFGFDIFDDINKKLFNNKFKFNSNKIIEKSLYFLPALSSAKELYKYIYNVNGGEVVYELSLDETDVPQDIEDIILILIYMDFYSISLDTIAPKFIGEFYKGIDYVGDVDKFGQQFEDIVKVIKYFNLNSNHLKNLKISIHSGSDKFSIYKIIKNILIKHKVGLHLKTAGTTWLEEIHGIALGGNDGLDFVKNLYSKSLEQLHLLEEPYKTVVRIDKSNLPSSGEFINLTSEEFEKMLVNDVDEPLFNPDLRQVFHIGYKLAIENKDEFYILLKKYHYQIRKLVFRNLYERHIEKIFINRD